MPNDLSSANPRTRPVHRNLSLPQLMSYRLPLAGILSILHRISGALMFLVGIPLMLYLFDLSLTSEISWSKLTALTQTWWLRAICLGFIWSFSHHFCAGIRYLLLDTHRGLEKQQARQSAIAVFVASAALTVFFAFQLFKA
jgi:succinate dehydrogenase / fumarate reductase, cytochrome b subunit